MIASLGLPNNSYVVVGSGILGALGIRESSDIDMIVTGEVFDLLEKKGWEHDRWPDQVVLKQGVFDVGMDWYGDDATTLLARAQVIDGVPYLSLDEVYAWKSKLGREKDNRDLTLIHEYRSKKEQNA